MVRHGQTDWNKVRRIQGQLDSELDEAGRQQAIERSADFQCMRLAAVYSSSSLRARQTTELLLGERSVDVTCLDDLREVRLGVWQGHMWEDIEKTYPELVELHRTASPAFDVEGAETSCQAQQRGIDAIESIIRQHSTEPGGTSILVVSHGAIMKSILAHYAQVPLSHLHELPSLPNCAHCIVLVEGQDRTVEQIAGTAFKDTPWAELERSLASEKTQLSRGQQSA
jgi:probable phosphoglycerate mutase